MTIDSRIQQCLDELALRELVARYCRAIDRRDRELLLSVYHEDAIDTHGTVFEGGPLAYAAWQPEIMAQFELTAHHLTTIHFHIDADQAEGELYFIAYHRTQPPDAQEIVIMGRYLDRYERRKGEWRILRRHLVWDSYSSAPVGADSPRQLAGLGHVGAAREDLSYQCLPGLSRA